MRYLISLSGGLDSCVTLAHVMRNMCQDDDEVGVVTFDYGSKHNPYERLAAGAIASHYRLSQSHLLLDLREIGASIFRSHLMAEGGEIPEGHYEAPSMKQTVVPGRNLLFISILAAMSESWGYDAVVLGTHSGDHHIYPDCRPAFLDAARMAVLQSTEGRVTLVAPFTHLTKGQIVSIGNDLQAPFHLARTCYKDQALACGKCGACTERMEAFRENGLPDPVAYA